MNLPIERSGYKFLRFQSEITVDGKQIVLAITVCDPATEIPMTEYRFFTDFDGLSMLIGKLVESVDIAKTMLQKSGELCSDSSESGAFLMFKIDRAGAGIIPDEQNVALEIRTADGPSFRFWMPPNLAQGLGQQLIGAAKEATGKSQRH